MLLKVKAQEESLIHIYNYSEHSMLYSKQRNFMNLIIGISLVYQNLKVGYWDKSYFFINMVNKTCMFINMAWNMHFLKTKYMYQHHEIRLSWRNYNILKIA